ncbi:hypothetical protein TrVE_jg5600 [Triparma verrucosa]|uniref:Uncharacterized protein n=1 Tax=Triparma verrucosa TaxID=1606542 RepID=A0A9W7BBI9_9STRA|nr:hypothetical protein TrVE_jg5600 [Triparma verrucosa]
MAIRGRGNTIPSQLVNYCNSIDKLVQQKSAESPEELTKNVATYAKLTENLKSAINIVSVQGAVGKVLPEVIEEISPDLETALAHIEELQATVAKHTGQLAEQDGKIADLTEKDAKQDEKLAIKMRSSPFKTRSSPHAPSSSKARTRPVKSKTSNSSKRLPLSPRR